MISPDDLITFLEKVHSIEDIPGLVCERLCATHCVIWKPSNTILPAKELPELSLCRLFPFTSTFQVSEGVLHSGIPVDLLHDTSGRFYREYFESIIHDLQWNGKRFSHDFGADDQQSESRAFMEARHLRQVCFAPIKMPDHAPWAICIYRPAVQPKAVNLWNKVSGWFGSNTEMRDTVPAFTDVDAENLASYARLLPRLIESLIDKDFQPKIQKISTRLSLATELTTLSTEVNPLQEVAHDLAASLHCLEVSVFLTDDPSGDNPEFTLQACTLDRELQGKQRFGKSFHKDKGSGLTSYVLATGETLEFHDLRDFRDDHLRWCFENRHPGIIWRDSCRIRDAFMEIYPDVPEQDWPPVSFLCVPIVARKEVIGAIRCSHGTNPYFFTVPQANSLKIVSDIIARWWMDRLDALRIHARANLFKDMLAVQDGLRREIAGAFEAEIPDPGRLVSGAVGVIFSKIHGVQRVSYRRFSGTSTDEMELVDQTGEDTLLLSIGQKFARGESVAKPILTVEGDQDALWHENPMVEIEPSAPGSNAERNLLARCPNWLFVRVRFKRRLLGVLDFGFQSPRLETDWKEQFQDVAVNLAKQLAIYEDLCSQKAELRATLAEKQAMAADQLLMTNAVGHQIKSPLANAVDIIESLDRVQRKGKESREGAWSAQKKFTEIAMFRLPALKGCLAKAQTVGRSMELFEALSEGRDPGLQTVNVSVFQLKRRAVEIAHNNEAVESAVDSPVVWTGDFTPEIGQTLPFPNPNPLDFEILLSTDTIDQVLDAVFGNAYKYGKAGKPITVNGALNGDNYKVTISNYADTGKELTNEDVIRCCMKRWRSRKLNHIPGSGLGLWIASELLGYQGGKLTPIATDQGITKFDLEFKIAAQNLRNTNRIPVR